MALKGINAFVGEYRHNLDGKNRLTIPAKWRFDGDQEDAFLALPDDSAGCITVYPPAMIEKLQEIASGVGMGDQKKRKALVRLFSRAEQMGCDKNGRISLPERLCAAAGIEREAVLAGGFNTFQIWNPERYAQYLASDDEDDATVFMELGL